MHIAFHYPGLDLGGQQTYTLRLMAELAALGHRVTWIYHYGDALRPDVMRYGEAHRIRMPRHNVGRIALERATSRLAYRLLGTLQLEHYCGREAVDVLVSATTRDSILGARVARRTATRHFRLMGGSMKQVEAHWLAVYRDLGVDKWTKGYFGWPAVFDELAEAGVNREKCVVLPMAVDSTRHFPLPHEVQLQVRASLGIPSDAVVVGWIGRVAKNMQVWDTIELARRLKAQGRHDFWLLLVGGGDALPDLEAEIALSGLAERTVVTGWVPYARVNEMTNAMDIVPLLERDPHGGSIVREAMAAGRVALSVDGPSHVQQEFMKPGVAVLVPSEAYLENATDAVTLLASDARLRTEIGVAAAEYARTQMSFRRVAEAMLAGIEKLS